MNEVLIEKGFKFKIVLCRKPIRESFTVKEYRDSASEVISLLPSDLQVTEISIETNVYVRVNKQETEMETVMYYKEPA